MKFKKPHLQKNWTLGSFLHGYREQPLNYFLATSIVLISLIKLSLAGSGFLAFPDELRYFASGRALESFVQLNFRNGIAEIFSTQGRPADAILKLVPNFLQFVSGKLFGVNYYEPSNSYPLFIFNYVVYGLILFVHYRFSKILLKDAILALLSVLLFCTLTSSHLYLRHALPYDTSLLVFYFVIYKIVKHTNSDSLILKKTIILGAVSFFGYLIYPGYFTLYLISLFLLFFNNLSRKTLAKKVRYSFFYGLGSILCLVIFEMFSRFAGGSYIMDALTLSGTISQGSFDESFMFIIKYLFEVEFISGVLIMISLVLFCLVVVYQIKKKTIKKHSVILLLGIGVLGMYLAYASAGYFLHKMVFYGRLLHQYFPFICILSLFAVNEIIKEKKKKHLVFALLSIAFIVNFGINFIEYTSYSYPRDIAWELSKTNNISEVESACEYEDNWSVIPSDWEFRIADGKGAMERRTDSILLLNCNFIFPVDDMSKYKPISPEDDYLLVKSVSYFLNFKAYQYEGFEVAARENLDKMNLQIKVYSKENS